MEPKCSIGMPAVNNSNPEVESQKATIESPKNIMECSNLSIIEN